MVQAKNSSVSARRPGRSSKRNRSGSIARGISFVRENSLGRTHRLERSAAAANPRGIGIHDAKAGAGQAILKIEGGIARENWRSGSIRKATSPCWTTASFSRGRSSDMSYCIPEQPPLGHLDTQTFAGVPPNARRATGAGARPRFPSL